MFSLESWLGNPQQQIMACPKAISPALARIIFFSNPLQKFMSCNKIAGSIPLTLKCLPTLSPGFVDRGAQRRKDRQRLMLLKLSGI